MARTVVAGLTPPGFRDDVSRRMQIGDESSDPYRIVQLMKEMLQTKWSAINGCQRGARFSGRGGWKESSRDRRHSSPRGEAHSSGASARPIEESCWSCGSTEHKKKKCFPRETKATQDGRGGAGDRGPSGGRTPSGSLQSNVNSGGVVRPGTGTQGPAGRTRWQQ